MNLLQYATPELAVCIVIGFSSLTFYMAYQDHKSFQSSMKKSEETYAQIASFYANLSKVSNKAIESHDISIQANQLSIETNNKLNELISQSKNNSSKITDESIETL